MTSVRRALALSFVERYFSIVLALGSNMVLARLLSPEQIGLYSVSLAVIGIAHVLREFGVGNFLIQQKDLTEAHVRTAFGLALSVGGGLALLIFTAAPWVARFYEAPAMVGLMRIVALNFLVLPLCTISLSLLRRDMHFQTLLYVNLTASVVGTAVTLTLAWTGQGPASLAVGSVAGNLTTGFGAWWARGRPTPLRPGWSAWRDVLGFGSQSALTGVVNTVVAGMGDLVIGKTIGLAPVAILSRAQGLVSMFTREIVGAIRGVLYPAFAKEFREGGNVEVQHVRAVSYTTVVGWPFFGFATLFSLEVIRLLYGPQWDNSAHLIMYLTMGGAAYCASCFVLDLLVAVGRIDLVTRIELCFQIPRGIALAFVALTTRSLEYCALVYTASQLIYLPFVYYFKQRCVPTDWRHFTSSALRTTVITCLTLAGPAAVSIAHGAFRTQPMDTLHFLGAAVIAVLSWMLSILLLKHPISREPAALAVLQQFRNLMKARARD